MSIFDLILLAVGVSMDAFAVSIAKGLATRQLKASHYSSVALWFGGFQALMPLLGYFVGSHFAPIVESCDHWIAFVLLALIGSKMLYDTLTGGDEDEGSDSDFRVKTMFVLAVATSIDALAIGISLAFLKVDIWSAILFIGVTTAIFSIFGLWLGHIFGYRYKRSAEICGGVVLILIGAKILVEHLAL